jgi:hypothetical protein
MSFVFGNFFQCFLAEIHWILKRENSRFFIQNFFMWNEQQKTSLLNHIKKKLLTGKSGNTADNGLKTQAWTNILTGFNFSKSVLVT